MNTITDIETITYDNIELFKQLIDEKRNFHIRLFNSTLEDKAGDDVDCVTIVLDDVINQECDITFDMYYEQALFFAKSIIALIECKKYES